ncbi:MAG: acetate--CoA ligase family protein [Gammaproteobacteria bacterium]|nr:acetate--CoA ligase family protein [Gammaproteobacteria bacterium]
MDCGARVRNLRRLLAPASVAVIGGGLAAEVIRQSERAGYRGELWPVHPRRATVGGRRCHRSVDDLPAAPDAAFIAVNAEASVAVVAQLAKRGAGGAVCYASGFAECGAAGKKRQARLVAAAADMALVGPNCYGVLNYVDGAALWPDQHGGGAVDTGVAIISQSGNLSLTFSMQQRALPIAYLIAAGNQAALQLPHFVHALLDDRRVKAIGLHFEGVGDARALAAAAMAALKRKVPLVALKSGASKLGARAALSHTSALSGRDELYDSFFRRFGIARVHSVPQFLEALKFLFVHGALPDASAASISCSGGEAAAVADLAEELHINLPPLSDAQQKKLSAVLGPRVALANPLDYHTYIWGDPDAQQRCFAAVCDGAQAVTLKVMDFPRADRCDDRAWRLTCGAFTKAAAESKTRGAVTAVLPETMPPDIRRQLLADDIAPMQGLEECLRAIRAAADIHRAQERVDRTVNITGARVDGCDGDVTVPEAETTVLDLWQSRTALAAAGLTFPPGKLCNAGDAAAAAVEIGFPVAVKAVAADLAHKTEAGAVRLNLQSESEVAAAVAAMAGLSERFVVEAMAPAPLAELLLGARNDSVFGPALTIAGGGVWAEQRRDAVSLLLPAGAAEVADAIAGLAMAPVLQGARGGPAADWDALVAAALAVAAFAEQHAARLVELDVNPLFALPRGAVAVDALLRLRTKP